MVMPLTVGHGSLYGNVIVILLVLVVCTSVLAGQYDAKAQKLLSADHLVRSKALRELTIARNRSGAKGETFDIANKYEIFVKVCKIDDIGHVYGTARLLSRLPVDEKLLDRTRQIVAMQSGETNKQVLIAALQYLRSYDKGIFNAYFKDKAYENIDKDFVYAFMGSEIINVKEDQYYRQLITSYLAWKPSPDLLDSGNPFRPKLLSLDRNTLATIFREMYTKPQRVIPPRMIWLWGEMGAIESVPLLDVLLDEYAQRPSPRTAISIGSSLGTLSIDWLYDYGFTEKELREILSHIYGKRWQEVQDKTLDEIKAHWLENWLELRESCKKRSVPQLG